MQSGQAVAHTSTPEVSRPFLPSQLIDKVCVEPVATVDISSRQQEASVCRQGLLPSISTTKMRCRHLQAHATQDRLVCWFLAGWLVSPAVLFCGADISTPPQPGPSAQSLIITKLPLAFIAEQHVQYDAAVTEHFFAAPRQTTCM
jgi:hypothetical protein